MERATIITKKEARTLTARALSSDVFQSAQQQVWDGLIREDILPLGWTPTKDMQDWATEDWVLSFWCSDQVDTALTECYSFDVLGIALGLAAEDLLHNELTAAHLLGSEEMSVWRQAQAEIGRDIPGHTMLTGFKNALMDEKDLGGKAAITAWLIGYCEFSVRWATARAEYNSK